MYLLKSMHKVLVAVSIIYPVTYIDAKLALTELKGFSSCMTPEYIYLSPVMGALYETYAKNLALFGNQTSEAVILLHELVAAQKDSFMVDSTNNPTAIGRYLDPADIGAIIGPVVLHKNGSIDERTMVRKIADILKKVLTRKQYEIKKAITDDLQQTIIQDNKRYGELENSLIKLYDKKERADLKNALLDVSRTWNKNCENVVLNKLNTHAQQKLFAQLKDLHRKLRQNRTFLDLEQRSCDVASPILKDSMGAFAHAIAGALSEEGTLYLHNNTTNLLLALLWHKAKTQDDLLDALKAMAHALSIEPDNLYKWHNQVPYTLKDYEKLKTKTESQIAALPLEDIVFARFAYPLYETILSSSSIETITIHKDTACPYSSAYFKSFVRQLESTADQNQKAILESLVASWALQWSDVNAMDKKIIYCRFLMQPTQTAPERIAVVLDLCQGNITMTGMVDYYLDAITYIYLSLPKDFHVQQMFFDAIIKFIINSPSSNEIVTQLKNNCIQWIKQAEDDATKAAILHVIITNHLFDTSSIEGFQPFDAQHTLVTMAKTIQSDAFKVELIKLIPLIGTPKNDREMAIIQELYEWAIAMLPTTSDESTKVALIKHMTLCKMPEDSRLQKLLQQYYSWATAAVADLQDDNKKADLIIDALTRSSSGAYPTDKHDMALLAALINKTLPSIHQDAAIIKIMTQLADTFPCEHKDVKELYRNAYEWLAQKFPLVADEKTKTRLINVLLERIATAKIHEPGTFDSIYKAIEKGLQSIHDVVYKTQAMRSIFNHPVNEQEQHKKLYATMYQWIERNISDIKDSQIREEMLTQLLQATKKWNSAENPAES